MTFRILILICLMSAICCAELNVNVLEDSSRVCYLGDSIKLNIKVEGNDSGGFEGVLVGELVNYWGGQTKEFKHPLTLKQPAANIKITMQIDVPDVGYYQVNLRLIGNGTTVLDREKAWSIAVFDYPRNFPLDSPFGTYTIGNVDILADIVPQGFYKNMAQIGVRWGTIDTWWKDLEPEEGRYNWAYYDRWFNEMLRAGITPIPHLFGIPNYASSYLPGNKGDYWTYPPSDWDQWEKFVYDFVEHYKDWLVYLRIWNEPNCAYWRGTAADYAKLVQAACRAAKRSKPDIKIIIEVVANSHEKPFEFLDEVQKAGALPYCDVVGIHNYFLNNSDYPERTEFLPTYDKFIGWRNKNKPDAEAWDTEFACMAEQWGGWIGVGERHQAQWLGRTHVLGFARGLSKMIWFPGYSWPESDSEPYYNPAGLLRVDLTPRPAYVAYHTMASVLSWAEYEKTLSLSDNRHAVVFKTPEGYVTALWSVDIENACRLKLKFKQQHEDVSIMDIMGRSRKITLGSHGETTVDISEDIIYVLSKSHPDIDSSK
jgi:hypothetical protein